MLCTLFILTLLSNRSEIAALQKENKALASELASKDKLLLAAQDVTTEDAVEHFLLERFDMTLEDVATAI